MAARRLPVLVDDERDRAGREECHGRKVERVTRRQVIEVVRQRARILVHDARLLQAHRLKDGGGDEAEQPDRKGPPEPPCRSHPLTTTAEVCQAAVPARGCQPGRVAQDAGLDLPLELV
eukprot:scaffold12262_cov121-Isochrysis_galbana.AAC.5